MYPNAIFYRESNRIPALYSGYVPSSGYFVAPRDVYFNGDFTLTVWVYAESIENWARLIDFGNGSPRDNVEISLSTRQSGFLGMVVFNDDQYPDYSDSTEAFPLRTWVHLAAVLKNTTVRVFINASFFYQSNQNRPRNVLRATNYIGKSNWDWHSLANAKFRSLKIFNKPLSSTEVLKDFNYYKEIY